MTDWENDIRRYKQGEMTPREQHAFEKKMLNDPFLAEAVEGAELIPANEFSEDVAELQKKIKVKSSHSRWFWPLRIAASVILILVVYFIINTFIDYSNTQQETLSLQTEKSEPQPAPQAENKEESATEVISEENEKSAVIGEEKNTLNEKQSISTQSEEKILIEKNESTEYTTADKLDKQIAESLESERRITRAEGAQVLKEEAMVAETQKKSMALKSTVPALHSIKGKVVFAEDGKPLPGTNVLIKGTNQGTVTDMNGEYSIATSEAAPTLVFSFIGFQSTEVNAEDKPEVNVSLQPDVSQLSEVVVTGYSPQQAKDHEPVLKLAEPVGGRKAYDKYLQTNLRYPTAALDNKIKGKVTLQFTVHSDGRLDEFSILKGLGYGCDEEVIRLVKEGPQWIPTTEDNLPVESEVIVRVKFALPN